MTLFTSQLVMRDGGEVRYVTATEKGRKAWYFIRIYPEKYSEYKRLLKKDNCPLNKFGEILASGWGEYAPADVIKEMKHIHRVRI